MAEAFSVLGTVGVDLIERRIARYGVGVGRHDGGRLVGHDGRSRSQAPVFVIYS